MTDMIATTDPDEFLAHFGVKGMKWGVRHQPQSSGGGGGGRSSGGSSGGGGGGSAAPAQRKGLSKNQKIAIGVGTAATLAIGAAAVAYHLKTGGKLPTGVLKAGASLKANAFKLSNGAFDRGKAIAAAANLKANQAGLSAVQGAQRLGKNAAYQVGRAGKQAGRVGSKVTGAAEKAAWNAQFGGASASASARAAARTAQLKGAQAGLSAARNAERLANNAAYQVGRAGKQAGRVGSKIGAAAERAAFNARVGGASASVTTRNLSAAAKATVSRLHGEVASAAMRAGKVGRVSVAKLASAAQEAGRSGARLANNTAYNVGKAGRQAGQTASRVSTKVQGKVWNTKYDIAEGQANLRKTATTVRDAASKIASNIRESPYKNRVRSFR